MLRLYHNPYTSGMPNASIPTPQPVKQRKQFGAYGKAVGGNSVVFVSKVGQKPNIKANI